MIAALVMPTQWAMEMSLMDSASASGFRFDTNALALLTALILPIIGTALRRRFGW